MFLKSSDERRVGLGGAGALSHVYIQNPPLRCNISGSRGLFYDDGNKLLLSPTSDQVLSWKTSPLLSVNDAPTSDSISDGPILSIRYSLDGKVIGIQRSNHEIEFKNKETGETFMQRCKLESESILGFFWTDCPTCDIVLIKTSGLDLFSYESESKALHLVETKRLNVSWYLYTHESRLVLLASGMQCKTFVGFQFSSGGIIRLPRFEMEMAKAEANSKPVLAAEDVHIVTVYGRIYCLQVDSVGMMAHLYRFYRDAVVQQGSLPIYSFRIGVSVVDNVLLVHQVDAKVVILYDIFSNSEAPISAPLPLLLRSGSRFDASSSQTINLESTDASVHGVMYGDGWTFLVPDLICDPAHGTVWRIHLDLEAISASSSEVPFILEFLQRRRLESSKAKQLSIAIMRTVILERRSVTMISWAMDVLVASYSQLVKMGISLQGGTSNFSSNPSRIVIDEQISRLKTHGYNIGPDSVNRPVHGHVNPTKGSVSDTDENINPEFEKNKKGEIYGLGGKEGLKQPSIEGSGSEDVETSSLQHEVVGSCSNAFGSNPSDLQGSQVACTTISPDEMYTFVFAVVEEEMAADPAYLVGIIVEYLRSAASEKLKVHPNMYVLTIQLLARCERYAELGLFIINKILEPSKEVALQLLESGRQNVQTRRLGLDMLRQLALHHDYVSILVQDGYYFEALRYARKHKVLTLQPSMFLDAAFTSNNPQELAAVLRFFSCFTPSFNTTADFTTYYRILNEMC